MPHWRSIGERKEGRIHPLQCYGKIRVSVPHREPLISIHSGTNNQLKAGLLIHSSETGFMSIKTLLTQKDTSSIRTLLVYVSNAVESRTSTILITTSVRLEDSLQCREKRTVTTNMRQRMFCVSKMHDVDRQGQQ
jgi:hypothetical protein